MVQIPPPHSLASEHMTPPPPPPPAPDLFIAPPLTSLHICKLLMLTTWCKVMYVQVAMTVMATPTYCQLYDFILSCKAIIVVEVKLPRLLPKEHTKVTNLQCTCTNNPAQNTCIQVLLSTAISLVTHTWILIIKQYYEHDILIIFQRGKFT